MRAFVRVCVHKEHVYCQHETCSQSCCCMTMFRQSLHTFPLGRLHCYRGNLTEMAFARLCPPPPSEPLRGSRSGTLVPCSLQMSHMHQWWAWLRQACCGGDLLTLSPWRDTQTWRCGVHQEDMSTLCSLNLNLFRQCLSFGITCDIQLHFFRYVMFRLQGTELSRLSSIISVLTSFMSLSCVRSLFEYQEIVNVTSLIFFHPQVIKSSP